MLSVGRYSLPRMKTDLLGQLIMTGVPGKEVDRENREVIPEGETGRGSFSLAATSKAHRN